MKYKILGLLLAAATQLHAATTFQISGERWFDPNGIEGVAMYFLDTTALSGLSISNLEVVLNGHPQSWIILNTPVPIDENWRSYFEYVLEESLRKEDGNWVFASTYSGEYTSQPFGDVTLAEFISTNPSDKMLVTLRMDPDDIASFDYSQITLRGNIVPEPSSFLLALAGTAFIIRRRRAV